MNASSISRQLATLGLRPVAASDRSREGLRVTNATNRVRVSADLDRPAEARDLAIAARQALIGAGFRVETTDEVAFYVVGRD